jgi:hypothetical protein
MRESSSAKYLRNDTPVATFIAQTLGVFGSPSSREPADCNRKDKSKDFQPHVVAPHERGQLHHPMI